MEVKAGYKQTEIGIIPSDWGIVTLRSLVHPERKITYGIVVPGPEVQNGIPIIRAQDYSKGWVDLDDLYRVSPEIDKAYKRSKVIAGDVLFTIVGSVGNLAKVPSEFNGSNITQQTARLSFHNKQANAEYYLNVLQSDFGKREITNYTKSGVQPSLNLSDVEKFLLPYPPLAEQEAIAEALSDADAYIEALEQLVAKKRQVKQGAMQELLMGKRRLPGFVSEWKEISLGELGKIHRGVSYNPNRDLYPFDTNSTVRLLRSNNIQEAIVVFSDMQYVDASRVSSGQIMQNDDILICMANGSKSLVGKAGRFHHDDGYKYTFGAFMGCFRPSNQVDPDFAFYLYLTGQYRTHISILLAGSSINNLTPTNVEAFTIQIPTDMKEQTAIAEILSDMDAEIDALEGKVSKARQVKQGMMSELLTGSVRLV
jgi:type I restriction enzyme, S subunit